MRVIRGYDDVPSEQRSAALAIGNFDGVHRGHQALLAETMAQALRLRAPSGVMVFEPHPRVFFRPEEPHFLLTTLEQKLALIERLGLDFAAVLAFDQALAGMRHDLFVERVLVDAFRVRHVVVGYDFFFGKGRAGTPETLTAAGQRLGFGVTVLRPVAEAGEVFSSSAVRERLSAGDVRAAAVMLGYWWRVRGVVIGGARIGSELGFPTANIALPPGTALAHGIYAVRVAVEGRALEGAAYFGTRPSVDGGAPLLEVFLFDFSGDLYGRDIEVAFIGFVRPDQRFRDMEALKAQIAKDCRAARDILREVAANDPLAQFPLR
ncbi:MAG TPA: bifunctional riboflavin kinase/FAD synthetase [Hyphomicrobiaceae bacterium]|nr:bifunctional riboflavin kinase/FAD synthetase [Hyphomicrobiaceae bacterium]